MWNLKKQHCLVWGKNKMPRKLTNTRTMSRVCCCSSYSRDLREHETSLRTCNNEAHRCIVAMYHRSYMVHDHVHFAVRFFVSPYLHVPSFALPLRVERKKNNQVGSIHDSFCSKCFLPASQETFCYRMKIQPIFGFIKTK